MATLSTTSRRPRVRISNAQTVLNSIPHFVCRTNESFSLPAPWTAQLMVGMGESVVFHLISFSAGTLFFPHQSFHPIHNIIKPCNNPRAGEFNHLLEFNPRQHKGFCPGGAIYWVFHAEIPSNIGQLSCGVLLLSTQICGIKGILSLSRASRQEANTIPQRKE